MNIEWICKDENIDLIRNYNQLLRFVELDLINPSEEIEIPPLIIIGAPRCGSTVAYQLLVELLDVGYINKLIARFWEAPSIGAHLSENIFKGIVFNRIFRHFFEIYV